MSRLLDLLRLAFAQDVRVRPFQLYQLVATIATEAKESLPPAPLLPIKVYLTLSMLFFAFGRLWPASGAFFIGALRLLSLG